MYLTLRRVGVAAELRVHGGALHGFVAVTARASSGPANRPRLGHVAIAEMDGGERARTKRECVRSTQVGKREPEKWLKVFAEHVVLCAFGDQLIKHLESPSFLGGDSTCRIP